MHNTMAQRLLKFICQITSIKGVLLPFRTCKNHIFHQEAAQLSLKLCSILDQSKITQKFFLRIITLKGFWLAATGEAFTQGKIEQLWLPLGTYVPIHSSEWKPSIKSWIRECLGGMVLWWRGCILKPAERRWEFESKHQALVVVLIPLERHWGSAML